MPLAAVPNAVPLARVFARQTLHHWQLNALIEDAELVTSELTTNAIKATQRLGGPQRGARIGKIQVCLVSTGELTVIEVWDPDRTAPTMSENADSLDESGRGLLLVDHLARSWGYRYPATGGKTVWCQLQ